MQYLAGIDIGGTNIRCALSTIDDPGTILVHRAIKTPPKVTVEDGLELINQEIVDCSQDLSLSPETLAAVGCALPGTINSKDGITGIIANLHGWDFLPFGDMLGQRFQVPVRIDNDVNSAALGEFRYGAGRGHSSVVFMTVSTGVSAGIVIEGQVVAGHHYAAGELAYMIPDRQHLGKDWKSNGCLELTSAGIGLATIRAQKRGGLPTPDRAVEVYEAAHAGDEEAVALIERAADYLAQTAVAVGAVVDPEVLLLGGSIALHQPNIMRRIREVVNEALLFPFEVKLAALGGEAPLIGALLLASNKASLPV